MSKRRSTYQADWVLCRRRITKFLESNDSDFLNIEQNTIVPCDEIIPPGDADRSSVVGDQRQPFSDFADVEGQALSDVIDGTASGPCDSVDTDFQHELPAPPSYDNTAEKMFDLGSCIPEDPDLVNMEKHSSDLHCMSEDADHYWDNIDSTEWAHPELDSDTDDVVTTPMLTTELAKWACKHRSVSHNAVTDLLHILRAQGLDVPATASTLLQTPKESELSEKSGGTYTYLGLAVTLSHFLSKVPIDQLSKQTAVKLNVNIDGIPLFKSTSLALWPILCSAANILPAKPFAVALFCGLKKPCNLDFLMDFVLELKDLMANGMVVNGIKLLVLLNCVICDAPAKAMVKGTVQFNGRYGCDKCEQKGTFTSRMLFLDFDAPSRTNESFRLQTNSDHHKVSSPFCNLAIDMIEDFPIDYMHQVNLGVTKRLLLSWIQGPLKTRLSSMQIRCISDKLADIKLCLPSDFARRPRSLEYVKMWKATEFRLFLMYTGPVVLREVISEEQYVNFLCLSCGICFLMNDGLVKEYKEYAHQLLQFFIKSSISLYGKDFCTYNVHSLMHLSDVAQRYGCLENCSAYPFENFNKVLKGYIRSPNNPVVQLVRRLAEDNANNDELTMPSNSVIINTYFPDNCYMLDNGKYCLCIEHVNENLEAVCKVFSHASSFYKEPCDSRLLGIHKVKMKFTELKHVAANKLVRKAIFISLNDRSGVVFPFFHSL
jgi:hypothetical protein